MSYLDALFSLTGKVALVTGSNRGIGYSLARELRPRWRKRRSRWSRP